MSEINWQKELHSIWGDNISIEELYQAFMARMKAEGWIKHPLAADGGLYGKPNAEDRNWQHAPNCAARVSQGLCSCSAIEYR